MYAAERHRTIVAMLREQERVSVAVLAQSFGVTTETIRRDLELLDERGLVQRVHGGAVPRIMDFAAELGLIERQSRHPAEKAAIARRALEYVPPAGGSMILDSGTTTGTLALAMLENEEPPAVITNSVTISSVLSSRNVVDVLLLGGRVRGVTQSLVGSPLVKALASLRVDVAFMGTNGISLNHAFSTPDVEEAAVKTAMIASARRVIVLADSSKFGITTLHCFARFTEVDVLITDSGIAPGPLAKLRETGMEVVIA